MIEGVANVWMPVEDINRAKAFYGSTLELEVVKEDGNWVEFDADGTRIALNGREPRGTRSEGGPVLTFQPRQGLDAAVSELQGRGVEFVTGISDHEWGRVATFKDSESNDLQLYEPPQS